MQLWIERQSAQYFFPCFLFFFFSLTGKCSAGCIGYFDLFGAQIFYGKIGRWCSWVWSNYQQISTNAWNDAYDIGIQIKIWTSRTFSSFKRFIIVVFFHLDGSHSWKRRWKSWKYCLIWLSFLAGSLDAKDKPNNWVSKSASAEFIQRYNNNNANNNSSSSSNQNCIRFVSSSCGIVWFKRKPTPIDENHD